MIIRLTEINMIGIIDQLIPLQGTVEVVFDNNEHVVMRVRPLIFHLIFWNVARKWGIVITPEFIIDTSIVNSSAIGTIGTKILTEVRKHHPVYHDVVFDFNNAVNYLNRFVIDHCQEYHKAMSIVDLVDVANIPAIKKITSDKITTLDRPLHEARKYIEDNFARLYKELQKPHPQNKLYDFINLRFVKDVQLAHIFYQIGFRTDINEDIFRYPIQGNYLDGLQNVTEYCLEALSAKKSTFYNKDSLPDTEYFGRRQHILLSSIKHLYPGDCGTNVTIPFMITEKNKKVVMYCNVADGSQLITLDESNIDQFVGKVVQFRTPMVCRYQDGICEACGGKLLGSIPPGTHIGIFSGIQVTSVITQVVLSNKHMQSIRSVEYAIPSELNTMLFKLKGNIFVKPKLHDKFKDMTLVFPMNSATHFIGLSESNIGSFNSINETSFGFCNDLIILKGKNVITDQVHMEVNHQKPLYSKHFIQYIADHPEHVSIRDNMFMVSLKDYDFKNPLFKLILINDSMVRFVGNAQKLLERKIKDYKSIAELVNDFTNLVYTHVETNLVYLMVVLRAAMVSGKYDYRLPIVTDPNNVRFMTNQSINMSRSLGMLCAFQQLPNTLSKPSTYLIPMTYTAFDDFLNLRPKYPDRRSGVDRRHS